MFKSTSLLCASLVFFNGLHADQPDSSFIGESESPFFSDLTTESAPPTYSLEVKESTLAAPVEPAKPKTPFKSFTGKIKGKKVRLRTQPDLESSVAKELQRGDYLLVVAETEDFWAVEPPSDLKAYVFRSFVLENVVEGNRVNVRLHPSTEAPVISHLNSGDHVSGTVCEVNHKWLEIDMPETARFYVAKSFIENVGGPEVRMERETRLKLAKQQLELANSFAQNAMEKSYPEIDFDLMTGYFQTVIQEYSEFPQLVAEAKETLADLQEKFIDKKIAFTEGNKNHQEPVSKVSIFEVTDKMKLWQPVEEAIYLSWSAMHDTRGAEEYSSEQRLAAEKLSGIVEPYLAPVKSKPGDFILKENDLPVGYIYSTTVNLQNLVGKKVSLIAAPRPNNNFAFPAYFVLDVAD